MKENVGTVDRSLRVMVGVALLMAGLLGGSGALGIVLIVLGLVFTVTGLISHCPIYAVLGKGTVEKPDPRGH